MAYVQSNPANRRPKAGKIKPPRKPNYGPTASELWETLENSIREIHAHNAKNLSFEENYRYAYNMCMSQKTDELYTGVCRLVNENLDKLAREIIVPAFPSGTAVGDNVQMAQEGEQLLKAFRNVWEDHIGSMSKLRDVLKYMDRVQQNNPKILPIFDKGIQLFLDRIFHSNSYPIKSHLIRTLMSQIQVERDGYTINRSAVKGCVEVLMEIQDLRNLKDVATVYKKEFEHVFLHETETFYKAEGQRLLETCDATEYLRRVEGRFDQERSRTQYYLSSQTEAPLITILENHLLTPHIQTIVSMPSSGLDVMIDANKEADLARMFRLFITVPTGLPIMKRAIKDSIARRGAAINVLGGTEGGGEGDGDEGEADEPAADEPRAKGKKRAPATKGSASRAVDNALRWVQSVLDLKDQYEKLLRLCFGDDLTVQTTIGDAFESFINRNPKSPEFISLFIDENLRKGLKGKSDQEVDLVLEKTITVFRYISERDIFERYYKSHLAKRLLQGRSVSDDAERGMLAKLKVECGVQFTQKLEGMFNDLKISSEHMDGYREHLNKPHVQAPSVDLTVNVLTSTFWPMPMMASPCVFPPELDQASKAYERFYLGRHTGRRLTWQPSMGTADVRAVFKAKTHELNVSTYALVILLLFENVEEGDILTYEEIKNATTIEDADLQRHLQSLACAKFKVLKKHPPGRDVHPDDSFSFNHEFTCPMQKIKISTIASKVENMEQRKETMEKVDEERKHQIEACIVRIMKDRKHLSHNELVNEVTQQLSSRFQPVPLQIKKRIEALIERDYLDRGDDKKSYKYVA